MLHTHLQLMESANPVLAGSRTTVWRPSWRYASSRAAEAPATHLRCAPRLRSHISARICATTHGCTSTAVPRHRSAQCSAASAPVCNTTGTRWYWRSTELLYTVVTAAERTSLWLHTADSGCCAAWWCSMVGAEPAAGVTSGPYASIVFNLLHQQECKLQRGSIRKCWTPVLASSKICNGQLMRTVAVERFLNYPKLVVPAELHKLGAPFVSGR